ncbi:uncharacterized protein LOC128223947 [Mya arenaria]|uniref:uncharacterized protein LOC128223947 n=1 Tax=Mya arenaria TaxID=6604 RepID=UPI0022E7C50F|nr:uncharacterized protein LOC128223947 [Mya arenaria]
MAEGQGQDSDDNSDNFNDQSQDFPLNLNNGQVNLETIVHAYTNEYENLDTTLNEIDSWMDKLEAQNDSLSSQLDELLASSKQARREIHEELSVSQAAARLDIDPQETTYEQADASMESDKVDGVEVPCAKDNVKVNSVTNSGAGDKGSEITTTADDCVQDAQCDSDAKSN